MSSRCQRLQNNNKVRLESQNDTAEKLKLSEIKCFIIPICMSDAIKVMVVYSAALIAGKSSRYTLWFLLFNYNFLDRTSLEHHRPYSWLLRGKLFSLIKMTQEDENLSENEPNINSMDVNRSKSYRLTMEFPLFFTMLSMSLSGMLLTFL